MPITAPDLSSTIPQFSVTFRYVDADGGKFAQKFVSYTGAQFALADIQALANDIGKASNANLYSIELLQEFAAVADETSATDDAYVSVADKITLSIKNTTISPTAQFGAKLPAPEGVLVLPGGSVDITENDYIDFRTRVLDLYGSGWVADAVSFNQGERRNARTGAG